MKSKLKETIEALIFISQEPLTVDKILTVIEDSTREDIELAVAGIIRDYESEDRGIQVVPSGGGYIFATKPDHDPCVRRFLQIERKSKLSSAALETLSTVAYHQPITQAEISALRGVDSSSSLKTLLEKKLIKIIGRKKAPGNPLVYKTSEKFLQYFGLNSLDELPSEEEISKILQEEKNSEN